MLHTFLADDLAHQKVEEAARRAAATAELARASIERPPSFRVALGERLIRAGQRLAGSRVPVPAPAQADPCL